LIDGCKCFRFIVFVVLLQGGPLNLCLQGLLGSYTCYRPDVGYVQGMSFIAAVLILNMEEDDAFICFANLLNRPCQIAFFRLDELLVCPKRIARV
jgi:hypothetical protein